MRYRAQCILGAVLVVVMLAGCNPAEPGAGSVAGEAPVAEIARAAQPTVASTPASTPELRQPRDTAAQATGPFAAVASLEEVFAGVYENVNPSVVAIQVLQEITWSRERPEVPGLPFEFQPGPDAQPQPRAGLGSGFVWDTEGHEEQTLDVTLAARPDEQHKTAGSAGGVRLGIQALTLNPIIAQAMGLDTDQTGVLIGQIAAGSPADRAGLRGSDTVVIIGGRPVPIGGDIITAVEGTPVASVAELRAQLQEVGADGAVTLTILRDGERFEQEVALDSGATAE